MVTRDHSEMRAAACMSNWWPRLNGTGVPVPVTEIVTTDVDLIWLVDDHTPDGFDAFLRDVREAGDRVGWPCFLRTGHISGKHNATATCFADKARDLPTRIRNLVEESELVDFLGLPYNTWAVRERLQPVDGAFVAFGGLPVGREFRFFIDGGKVIGWLPYWPKDAVKAGAPEVGGWTTDAADRAEPCPNWAYQLGQMSQLDDVNEATLTLLSTKVAEAFADHPVTSAWSVDWMDTGDRGWVCIDMAPSVVSWGYEDVAERTT